MTGPSDHLHSIDVDAPIDIAYDRWTQFEDWPRFMDSVDRITQVAPDTYHWKVSIAGVAREFDATITEQVPNLRIAWTTDSGADHAGVVTFHAIDATTTRVTLQMDLDPNGIAELIGDCIGLIGRRLESDMNNFKALVEGQSMGHRIG